MVTLILVDFNIASTMDQGPCRQIVISMKANGLPERSQKAELRLLLMELNTTGILKITKEMDTEYSNGRTVKYIKDNGETGSKMEKES